MEKKALIASTQLRLFLLKESDVTLIHIIRVEKQTRMQNGYPD